MPDNLKQKAISGARWGFIENLSSLAVTFVVALILQRWFLSPHEFGLHEMKVIYLLLQCPGLIEMNRNIQLPGSLQQALLMGFNGNAGHGIYKGYIPAD